MSEGTSEEKSATGLWSQLPSFDPSSDDIREFSQKARFLHGVFPVKDKGNLAPRLAMLCKGTAWSQVRQLDPQKLTEPETGVEYLLEALSAWEETSELKTFELFEKCLYKVTQRSDEATHSYALRLHAAFNDLGGKITVQDMQAFVLLRQSGLSNEDKKRVLSMTNGELKLKSVEQAMRTLSTKVLLSSGEPRKKIYPTNYVEPDDVPPGNDDETPIQSTYSAMTEDDDVLPPEALEQMALSGDADALTVQQFEKDFEEMMQDVPDLQQALLTYQEARQRINDRRRGRGFWPSKSKGKGFNRDAMTGKGFRKGGQRSGKEELLARISRTHCKACGQIGHWKAECPLRKDAPREQANVVQPESEVDGPAGADLPQVIFEDIQAGVEKFEDCFSVQSSMHPSPIVLSAEVRRKVVNFLKSRMGKYHNLRGKQDKRGKLGYKRSLSAKRVPQQTLRSPMKLHGQPLMPTSEAECLASQTVHQVTCTAGLAILDTGASRSVIGSEHVPDVLQKLPPAVRSQIREVPSHVGFRFGNNQTAYSFKQLQIPLKHGRQRIWLLVEVVPKATPFLISIKTMKSLGANIDLSKNTCYLQKLNRSLPLVENQNGLFMIDMSDLCEESETNEAAAFVASSTPIRAPPGLDPPESCDHAVQTGSLRWPPNVVGGGDGESSNPVRHDLHVDQGHQPRRECPRPRSESDSPAGSRSSSSTSEDQRTRPDHHEQDDGSSQSIQWTTVSRPNRRFRSLGDHGGRRVATCSHGHQASVSGPRYFTSAYDDSNSDANAESSSSQDSSQDRRHTFAWSPIPEFRSCKHAGSECQQPVGPHSASADQLGPKEDHMGKETSGQNLFPGVRRGRQLRQVGSGSYRKFGRGNRGLRQLCGDTSTARGSSNECPAVDHAWQPIPEKVHPKTNYEAYVTTAEEVQWLKEVHKMIRKGNNHCQQLDVLEVYAYEDSKITQVAQACGLKARGFTKEDGDLSTAEGRSNLLMTVMLCRPKHLWLAPECAPWCAWNRFNAARSASGFQRVYHVQDEARIHLKLCNLLFKIQQSHGGHTHLENPWTSDMWNQKELRELLQGSLTAQLDQCMFGLRHPETTEAMQKRTRIQTTSRTVFEGLDHRLCDHDHEHQQIAGTCHWRGKSIRVSQFAGHYPAMFAKAIVKCILRDKTEPIESPVYHVDDEPEEPKPKKARTSEPEPPDANMEGEDSNPWKQVLEQVRSDLPKSGIKTWTNPMHAVFRAVQAQMPEQQIGAIKAGKGLDRFICAETGWEDEFPLRKTVVLARFTMKVEDLGTEDWTKLTKCKRHRHARPSHVMVCIFARAKHRTPEEEPQELSQHAPTTSGMEVPDLDKASLGSGLPLSSNPNVPVPTWTPMSASVSGPKFQELTEEDKTAIRRLHNNLGHPTAERLARHLSEANARPALIGGAKDYLCASCAERVKPALTTPGNLKDPKRVQRTYIFGWV